MFGCEFWADCVFVSPQGHVGSGQVLHHLQVLLQRSSGEKPTNEKPPIE